MLPMALVLAFMHFYNKVNLQLLLSILFYNFFKLVLKRRTAKLVLPLLNEQSLMVHCQIIMAHLFVDELTVGSVYFQRSCS